MLVLGRLVRSGSLFNFDANPEFCILASSALKIYGMSTFPSNKINPCLRTFNRFWRGRFLSLLASFLYICERSTSRLPGRDENVITLGFDDKHGHLYQRSTDKAWVLNFKDNVMAPELVSVFAPNLQEQKLLLFHVMLASRMTLFKRFAAGMSTFISSFSIYSLNVRRRPISRPEEIDNPIFSPRLMSLARRLRFWVNHG